MPVDDPIVATPVRLLLQCPPAVPSIWVGVAPTQTVEGPVIDPGGVFKINSTDAEDALQFGAAEVGIDQQNAATIQRQTGGQVHRYGALAVAGAWAGDQNAAGGVE